MCKLRESSELFISVTFASDKRHNLERSKIIPDYETDNPIDSAVKILLKE